MLEVLCDKIIKAKINKDSEGPKKAIFKITLVPILNYVYKAFKII